jgi:NADH-quinone oxidoreductase subunit J
MDSIGITISFWVMAVLAVVLSITAISLKDPLKSAFCLIGVFIASASIFLILNASLLAILQILVYAGAIMVFIIFVIMFINLRPEELKEKTINAAKILSPFIAIALIAGIAAYKYMPMHPVHVDEGFGKVQSVSEVLYTKFAFAFEAVSLLLLIAIIGAIVLSGKKDKKGVEK